jgi:hypothetical protein
MEEVDEVNWKIIMNLDYKSILIFSSVNRYYYKLCSTDYIWKNVIIRDYPNIIEYKPDNITYREMYYKLNMKRSFREVIRSGDLYVLIWFYYLGIVPDSSGLNDITSEGHLHILNWYNQHGIIPSEYDSIIASSKGYLDILKWFKDQNVQISEDGADEAATNGHIDILEWYKGYGIFPTEYGADGASLNGNLNVLEWMDQNGILNKQDLVLDPKHLGILKWMKKHGYDPPDYCIINALSHGYIETLNWLIENFYTNLSYV